MITLGSGFEEPIIYSAEKFENAKDAIRKAVEKVACTDIVIPVRYQYLQNRNTPGEPITDENSIIGSISNIYIESGAVHGRIVLSTVMTKTLNVTGRTVDNFIVKMDLDEKTEKPLPGSEELVAAVMYDKAAKSTINQVLKERTEQAMKVVRTEESPHIDGPLPRDGANPLIEHQDEIQKLIEENFKKIIKGGN